VESAARETIGRKLARYLGVFGKRRHIHDKLQA
jgi:hypothetical protein